MEKGLMERVNWEDLGLADVPGNGGMSEDNRGVKSSCADWGDSIKRTDDLDRIAFFLPPQEPTEERGLTTRSM